MEKDRSQKKNGKRIKRPNRFVFGLITFLLAIVLALSAGAFRLRSYAPILDNVFFVRAPEGPDIDALTREAQAITLREAEEGIVLLTNRDNTLPLKEQKINVFGRGSFYATYGGTGSGAGGTAYTNLYDGLKEAGFSVNPDLISFYAENA
ncbi:MAG: hypothetical protein ILO68_07065 [Clostridia bacterium]|nr:hypothetical protein [Clostridia bacterium]